MGPGGGEPNLVLHEALVKYGRPDRKANSLLIDLAPKQFPRDLFRAANDWLSQDLSGISRSLRQLTGWSFNQIKSSFKSFIPATN